ncbi:MAG: hypothetical protein JWO76_2461, partial [Nocardioides sp.]|nr:hypothetical protein [Nocardioides sp.]
SPTGQIADVTALSDSVDGSHRGWFWSQGVKFARIDVALTFQNKMRLTMAWQNPNDFARFWGNWFQIRMGLYYPVRTGDCDWPDPSTALTVRLDDTEDWTTANDGLPHNDGPQFCMYRELTSTGPGVVTKVGDYDRGTQLLATNKLVGTLAPQAVAATAPPPCTATGTTACTPTGLGPDRRTYLLIGDLRGPGGFYDYGHRSNEIGLDMFLRVSRVGG